MKFTSIGFAGAACALFAIPAFAHHSFAMFDADKRITIQGTVKEFQWTNPHAWIIMMVPNADGTPQEWSLEMGGPGPLSRQGFLPKTLTPGMKVTAVAHPLRDGSRGGQFMAVTLPDGKVMGNQNAAAAPNEGAN